MLSINAKDRDDEQNRIENARNALAHYSSKSTNETTILVGLAVARAYLRMQRGSFVVRDRDARKRGIHCLRVT